MSEKDNLTERLLALTKLCNSRGNLPQRHTGKLIGLLFEILDANKTCGAAIRAFAQEVREEREISELAVGFIMQRGLNEEFIAYVKLNPDSSEILQ